MRFDAARCFVATICRMGNSRRCLLLFRAASSPGRDLSWETPLQVRPGALID